MGSEKAKIAGVCRKSTSSSGVTGVQWDKPSFRWRTRLERGKERFGGKYFIELKDAVVERIRLEKEVFGARLDGKKTSAEKWLERYERRASRQDK